MDKWCRALYQPCIPLGENNSKITGCQNHIDLSRRAAGEGAVLLKNNGGILPLDKGSKIAVFGKAQIDYVKGGGGSGDVNVSYVCNIYDGLKLKNNIVSVFDELSLFYKNYVEKELENGGRCGMLNEPELPEELLNKAAVFTDTAIITINRYSEEDADRRCDGTDSYFCLSRGEQSMINKVKKRFDKIIVLLNVGAMIDTSWFADDSNIGAALMLWQGGMEGGLAAADILVGDVNPSGKLTDTCAISFDDYPSSEGFYESDDYVKYTEDIFVGYRYFETIPAMKNRVVYPFGFGLSYTTFELDDIRVCDNQKDIIVSLDVTNTGKMSGKEVVQVYYGAPTGKITKPSKELCTFAKTRLLAPGETQHIMLTFGINDMASYDDMGTIQKSAYVMEKGVYNVYIGTSVRDVIKTEYSYRLNEDKVIQQLHEYCAPRRLGKRLQADGSYVKIPDRSIEKRDFPCTYKIVDKPDEEYKLIDVVEERIGLDEFIAQLNDDDMIHLVRGHHNRGVANTGGMGDLKQYGIPAVMTVDGPAGVRIDETCGVMTTAFPVATLLACTWDIDLLEQIGRAGALETKENNLSIWLTPALNIHRSPLCGRNFEYFSEDPYVSGKMAAAIVRGVQSENIVAVPKHFACNNKETNRFHSDSIVSERALREIYIKGFEICIKESKPKMIMSSYNVVNGIHSSENCELLEGILRGEWGYKGMVTSDWFNRAKHREELIAGNDIRMPNGEGDNLKEALECGRLTREQLAVCTKRILEMILWLE